MRSFPFSGETSQLAAAACASIKVATYAVAAVALALALFTDLVLGASVFVFLIFPSAPLFLFLVPKPIGLATLYVCMCKLCRWGNVLSSNLCSLVDG